jgi:hypothetical protein
MMKLLLVGALAFLGGVILTFWLIPEPEIRHAEDMEIQSQFENSRTPAPSINLNGREQDEAIDAPSNADSPDAGVTVDVSGEPDSVVAAIPNSEENAVPMLPGIELTGDLQAFHEMLEEEVRDELWAASMEQELYGYFFRNSPELANNFGVPNVVCRSTICEVQTIGYGPGSLDAWQAATSDLDTQPWAEEFIQVQLGGNPIGPDVGGLVLILVRASGDAIVQSVSESVATI